MDEVLSVKNHVKDVERLVNYVDEDLKKVRDSKSRDSAKRSVR